MVTCKGLSPSGNTKKGDAKMEKLARKLENKAIRNWGFESKKTIAIFRLTELLRK